MYIQYRSIYIKFRQNQSILLKARIMVIFWWHVEIGIDYKKFF